MATEIEAQTVGVQSYQSSFFSQGMVDTRYVSSDYTVFYPQSVLNQCQTVDFVLPSMRSGSIYKIQDALIYVCLKLTKENGDKLDDTSLTAPGNNIVHTLFSDVKVFVNGVQLNPNSRLYAYKAYLQTVLFSEKMEKFAPLEISGYYYDSGRLLFDKNSLGFKKRRAFFRNATEYTTDEVPFLAPLYLDLNSLECGLPPGVEVRLSLTMNSDNFIIESFDDSPKYKVQLTKCHLHVPIATLSGQVFEHYLKTIEKTPVNLHYKRLTVSSMGIPKQTVNFSTDQLFPRLDSPTRLFLAFVETEAFNGSQKKCAYKFDRKWTVASADGVSSGLSGMLTGSGGMTTSTCYISRVYITLNGKEISSLHSTPAKENSDCLQYYAMMKNIGSTDSQSCGVTPDDFLNGYFVPTFDLSATNEAHNDVLISSPRLGFYRLSVDFNTESNVPLTMLIFAEFNSLATINNQSKLQLSYPH